MYVNLRRNFFPTFSCSLLRRVGYPYTTPPGSGNIPALEPTLAHGSLLLRTMWKKGRSEHWRYLVVLQAKIQHNTASSFESCGVRSFCACNPTLRLLVLPVKGNFQNRRFKLGEKKFQKSEYGLVLIFRGYCDGHLTVLQSRQIS
jgi:hypothetical protein